MRKFVVAFVLLAAGTAHADHVEVPVDLGIGPAAFMFIPSPVYNDQRFHYGLKISVEAIIDHDTVVKEKNRIPPQYRKMALGAGEIHLTPFPVTLIPEQIFISPKYDHTGIYGLTFKPLALGLAAGGGVARLSLNAGIVLTAAYLYSDLLPNTFFLRPGLSVQAELQIMPTKVFGFSLGWESAFYVPQALGGFDVSPIDQSIWHIGAAFFKLHFRFPYSANI